WGGGCLILGKAWETCTVTLFHQRDVCRRCGLQGSLGCPSRRRAKDGAISCVHWQSGKREVQMYWRLGYFRVWEQHEAHQSGEEITDCQCDGRGKDDSCIKAARRVM